MKKNEQVTVSGGSGYIASFIIAKLLEQGYKVNTTIRDITKSENVRKNIGKLSASTDGLTFFQADLNSDAGWNEALAGSKYGIHVASPFPAVNPKSADELIIPPAMVRLGFLRLQKRRALKGLCLLHQWPLYPMAWTRTISACAPKLIGPTSPTPMQL